ncbi:MAG: transposase [Geobacteraceae bacterium]|nr:transposase [Geobacteraceae bacterium]
MKKNQPRRQYDKQFKLDALELVLHSEKSIAELATDLGVKADMLYRWKYLYKLNKDKENAFPGTGHLKDSEAEQIRKLERELRVVQEERDILKKAFAVFTRTDP